MFNDMNNSLSISTKNVVDHDWVKDQRVFRG